jgi:hypothetical protein
MQGARASLAGASNNEDSILAVALDEGVAQHEKQNLAGVDVSSIDQTWIALGLSFLVAFLITCFAAAIEVLYTDPCV